MESFQGQALSWEVQDGVIELALHREPCNEMGSLRSIELEKFVLRARRFSRNEAHALIIYSELKAGFCAGADLRELYRRSQELERKRSRSGASAIFWSGFTGF